MDITEQYDKLREHIAQHAKDFKLSWVQLGQGLYSVWRDKLYHSWGFEKFEDYVVRELGLKKPLALKLVKTYFFVEQDEPVYLKKEFAGGRKVRGCDVDDITRKFIAGNGYGEYFIHRTGHNIGTEVHGNGANIDNLETHDRREIIPETCFSIEPGIYLPGEFGVRLEIDVYISKEKKIIIPGEPIQQDIVKILC